MKILLLYNRGCCRMCGKNLTSLSICIVCREDVSWICDDCGRVEDGTHGHDAFYD